MTDPATGALQGKGLGMLIIALLCWATGYGLFLHFAPSAGFFSENAATFIAAAVMTLLSAFVVHGFSCLRLHRTAYLLIGALAVAAVFHAAGPMVERSRLINRSGSIPGEILFISFASSGFAGEPDRLLMETRNRIFMSVNREVAEAIPEPAGAILLLCLLQLALASGIGLWIGNGIDAVSHLIPVAVVATLADIWSVSAGATSKIIVSSAINYFLLRFPLPGTNEIPYLIGLTDFLFFAIFFSAACRFGLGALRNAVLLLSSFLVAVAAAIFFSAGLPVLPFMAVIFVAGNFRQLELKREEIKQILIFSVVILAVFSAVTFFGR